MSIIVGENYTLVIRYETFKILISYIANSGP